MTNVEFTSDVVRSATFREKLKGYNPEDVHAFMERSAAAIDQLTARLAEASARALKAEAALASNSEADESVRRTLVLAQRTAEMAVREANDEAATIRVEARREADQLLADARLGAERTEAEAAERAGRLTAGAEQARAEAEAHVSALTAQADARAASVTGEAEARAAAITAEAEARVSHLDEVVAAEAAARRSEAYAAIDRETAAARAEVEASLAELGRQRDQLWADVEALTTYLAAERARVLEALQGAVDRFGKTLEPAALPDVERPQLPARAAEPAPVTGDELTADDAATPVASGEREAELPGLYGWARGPVPWRPDEEEQAEAHDRSDGWATHPVGDGDRHDPWTASPAPAEAEGSDPWATAQPAASAGHDPWATPERGNGDGHDPWATSERGNGDGHDPWATAEPPASGGPDPWASPERGNGDGHDPWAASPSAAADAPDAWTDGHDRWATAAPAPSAGDDPWENHASGDGDGHDRWAASTPPAAAWAADDQTDWGRPPTTDPAWGVRDLSDGSPADVDHAWPPITGTQLEPPWGQPAETTYQQGWSAADAAEEPAWEWPGRATVTPDPGPAATWFTAEAAAAHEQPAAWTPQSWDHTAAAPGPADPWRQDDQSWPSGPTTWSGWAGDTADSQASSAAWTDAGQPQDRWGHAVPESHDHEAVDDEPPTRLLFTLGDEARKAVATPTDPEPAPKPKKNLLGRLKG